MGFGLSSWVVVGRDYITTRVPVAIYIHTYRVVQWRTHLVLLLWRRYRPPVLEYLNHLQL